jgi:membrane fusion protein, multidrug efflux system
MQVFGVSSLARDFLSRISVTIPCLVVALSLGISQGALAQGRPPTGPSEVGVVALAQQSVPYTVTLPGRAVAHDQTEVRPRVEGVIEEIAYTSGATVSAGDLLFRLDSDTYEAALEAAKAAKVSAESALAAATSTVTRYRKLNGVGITQSDLDSAEAGLAQAQANVASAAAALKTAQLNLDRTDIRSPINGIVDLPQFSVGALVTANQSDPLTTVTSINPIYVDVQESSARMLRVRNRIEMGTLQPIDPLGIVLTLETGATYEGAGTLVSPRIQVSTTTGSLDFRIQFDNPDRLILPGQFLRVALTLGTTQAILVPQRATSRSSDGSLTAYLARDGIAHEVTLTAQGAYQNAWIVTDGVNAGDQLIVDGLRNLKAGAEITTIPVTIDKDGLVEETPGTQAPGGATPEGQAPAAPKAGE